MGETSLSGRRPCTVGDFRWTTLAYRLAYNGDVVAFKMGRRRDPAWHISMRFRTRGAGRDALPRGAAVRRSTAVSRAAP